MDRIKETTETWNNIASLYEEKFMYLDIYDETYKAFVNALPNGNAKVLEIGCGPGNITHYLLKQRPGLSVHGIDVASNMIELAKKNNPAATFEVMDCRDISKFNTIFEGIVVGFCLPFLTKEETVKLIDDCKNLLPDGGPLYISFMDGDDSLSGYKAGSNGDKVYFNYHPLKAISQALLDHGFEQPTVFRVQYQRDEKKTAEEHTIVLSKKVIQE